MISRLPAAPLLLCILLLGSAARAQEDDAPIPYPEEGSTVRERLSDELPPDRHDSPDLRRELEDEDGPRSLARLDDPNLGVGGELLGGLLLTDRADAGPWAPRFAWGVRFNWEFGRLISDELLREALFLDVTWTYGASREGTQRIFADAHYHYFTVAPAWEFHLDRAREWSVFGQLGVGAVYQLSDLHHDGSETLIAGLKPAFQYGLGLRGRPLLSAEGLLRLSVRIELTRYRRGYMDDTLLAGGIGTAF